jgi:hypothetical protein
VQFSPGTNFDALRAGQSVQITAPYTMRDAGLLTSNANLVLTINGTNDAPVITSPAVSGALLSSFVLTNAMLNVNDVDHASSQVSVAISNIANVQFNLDGDSNGSFETANISSFTLEQLINGRVEMQHLGGVPTASLLATDIAGTQSNGNVAQAIGFSLAPIALDLNGDGFHFVRTDDSHALQFDLGGTDTEQRIAWVDSNDGVLVVDSNHDGRVTDRSEFAFADFGSGKTDIQALAENFDTNRDGVLDAHDAQFADFRVWHDVNQNGSFETTELVPLGDFNITSLSLNTDPSSSYLGDHVTLHGLSSFERLDGSHGMLADVSLRFDNAPQTLPLMDELVMHPTGGILNLPASGPLLAMGPVTGPGALATPTLEGPTVVPATIGPANQVIAGNHPVADGPTVAINNSTPDGSNPSIDHPAPTTPPHDDVPVDAPSALG